MSSLADDETRNFGMDHNAEATETSRRIPADAPNDSRRYGYFLGKRVKRVVAFRQGHERQYEVARLQIV